MREITDHEINGLNEVLKVVVLDEPGDGGANHRYQIHGPIQEIGGEKAPKFAVDIKFQKGPIKEAGVNGISNEALLAVVIDRLRGFQSGPFNCEENAQALEFAQQALKTLQKRTFDRTMRGVEGTHEP